MFQTALTIKEIIKEINEKYYLPAIQREFVWSEDQIISLFDSLLKGFPIGSFLFWNVKGKNLKDFDFYKFIIDYSEFDNYHNETVDSNKLNHEITAILDGQQRITSILIGFYGSFSVKSKGKRYDDISSYPKRHLYISLSKEYEMEDIDDIERGFKLKFLTEEDANNIEEDNWFKVSDILSMELKDITKFALKNQLSSLGIDILSKLYDVVNSRIINYYLETSEDIDKVLNIFVRINSGGTHLSYSDLLLSIATAKWENVNARDEINELIDEINSISEGFNVGKDFILKTSLFLLDRDMKFKVANFTNEAMNEIEANWEQIKSSILRSFNFLSKNGFYYKTLISNYPAAVVAYFIFNGGDIELNKHEIIQFINKSLLKSIYSSSIDSVLISIRKSISKMKDFKVKRINENLPSNKKLNFSIMDIRDLLQTRETQKSFMLILTLLYERNNLSTINHIIPYSIFVNFDEKDLKKCKTVLNYQLIDLEYNIKISNLSSTIENNKILNVSDDYFNGDVDLYNIDNFFEVRQKNIEEKLKEFLK